MPTYEYRCSNGHTFEVVQRMADDPVETCEECGAPVERVFHPVAVHFKGSGFYTTDYAKQKQKQGSDPGAGDSASDSGDKGSDPKGDKGSDSKGDSADKGSASGESKSSDSGSGEKAKAAGSKSD